MSGVCGLVRLDGRPLSGSDLQPIMARLANRGPDGAATWASGSVALGFASLATTPEAADEVMPLRHGPSGCAIVADARLDNREELGRELGLDLRGRGNGELILHAYLRWGLEAPLHLLGDYAFLIHDERQGRVLAVRDPVGMRQLHYAWQPGRMLALATDDRALGAHPDIPVRLNEARVADLLEDLEGADLTSTFYVGIERLPPAHLLLLEHGRLQVRRYWQLDPPEPLLLASEQDYAEAFLDVFDQAVAARLRSNGPAGVMLSGGIDSAAIAASASRLQGATALPSFSAVRPGAPDCIETALIRRIQAACNILPFEVVPGEMDGAVDDLGPALSHHSPFDGHMVLPGANYGRARQAGCRIMLDGAAADVVLNHRNWTGRLLRSGEWRRALDLIEGQHWFGQGSRSRSRLLLDAARAAFLPDWARQARRKAALLAGRVIPRVDVLRHDFARRVDLAGRRDLYARTVPSPALPYAQDRARTVLHNDLIVGRERYDRVAARFGVEARDPYLDLRVIRLSLSLPPERLGQGGWTKHVLRSSMEGRLPDEVRWRRGKEHLGATFLAALLKAGEPLFRKGLERQRPRLQSWIRAERLETLEAGPGTASWNNLLLFDIVYLSQWLEGDDSLTLDG